MVFGRWSDHLPFGYQPPFSCSSIPTFLLSRARLLYHIMWSRLHAPVPPTTSTTIIASISRTHPYLRLIYALLCSPCHNSVALYLEFALLSFLSCVFLLAPVCSVYLSCLHVTSRMSTITSIPVAAPPLPLLPSSDLPYSSTSTPLLFLYTFLSSELQAFQCTISTSSTGAFKTSPPAL